MCVLLKLQSGTSYFPVRDKSFSKYKSDNILKFYLTHDDPEWNPGISSYFLQVGIVWSTLGDILLVQSQWQAEK